LSVNEQLDGHRHEGSYDVGVSGGVVYINKSAFLTRPVDDSFALVKVGQLDGVRVDYSNQESGTTNANGEIVLPNLVSYYDNDVSIDPKGIPVNYEIERVRRHVSPPVRGGSVVEFPVTRLQGFTGYLYVVEQGERKPAQYWGLRLKNAGVSREFTIGKGGEFYLKNLSAGTIPAAIFWQDRECHFELNIPKTDAIMVDMGEQTCEIH
jgi:outer membrane usher protein